MCLCGYVGWPPFTEFKNLWEDVVEDGCTMGAFLHFQACACRSYLFHYFSVVFFGCAIFFHMPKRPACCDVASLLEYWYPILESREQSNNQVLLKYGCLAFQMLFICRVIISCHLSTVQDSQCR